MVYGYAVLGIPIQSGSALIPPHNHPYHYLNQLHLDYNLYIDHQLLGEWDAIPAAFDAQLDAGAEYIVTCDHPTILLHSQFVDSINFGRGRNTPRMAAGARTATRALGAGPVEHGSHAAIRDRPPRP